MLNIRMILFDFDGTLDNSTKSTIDYIIAKMRRLHLHAPSYDFVRRLWGKPYKEVMSEIQNHCRWSEEDLQKYFSDIDVSLEKISPFPGIDNLIFTLHEKGVVLGIISNRGDSLSSIIERCNINIHYFDIIQNLKGCDFHKPDPRVFEKSIELAGILEIEKEQILYVGDTLIDYEASMGAGIKFIGITSGATTEEEFVREGLFQECVFDSPTEITSILNLG